MISQRDGDDGMKKPRLILQKYVDKNGNHER